MSIVVLFIYYERSICIYVFRPLSVSFRGMFPISIYYPINKIISIGIFILLAIVIELFIINMIFFSQMIQSAYQHQVELSVPSAGNVKFKANICMISYF